jgi:hypothetical protein
MNFGNFAQAVKLSPRRELGRIAFLVVISLSTSLWSQVSVTISPSTVTLATLATQAFTVTVSGSTNTAVTWQVNGVNGGSSSNGLISTTVLGTSNEAIYLAPTSVPSPASVSVTAISQADTTKSATATVTIQLPSRSGRTYYVSASGNDNNAGTVSAPWRTIQKAANTVSAGDTVQVRAGTYNEIVTMKTSGNAASGYITFQNYQGRHPSWMAQVSLWAAAAKLGCSASREHSTTSSFRDSKSGITRVHRRAKFR